MKKVKKFLLGNIKTVVAFILGGLIIGGSVYAATILFQSNIVGYNNATSGMSATNVQAALDELYTKANTWIDPSYIDFGTLKTNSGGRMIASSSGICIKRNGIVSRFRPNNYNVEKNHIQQVFSDISCTVTSTNVTCSTPDLTCRVESDGYISCYDAFSDSGCSGWPNLSATCN